MKPPLTPCLLLLAAWIVPGLAQERGVISDPDGYTNLRAKPDHQAKSVAKVLQGEVFEFEFREGSPWWQVRLPSGTSGWMHSSRIQAHHTLDELPPQDEPGSEVGDYGRSRGFDYAKTARAAAQGDPAAMQRFFGIDDADGAAAESHVFNLGIVIHVLGDARLASFLEGQRPELRASVRNWLDGEALYPFAVDDYLPRNFPLTFAVLARQDLLHWPSPDGRFAIRKLFSEGWASEESRVIQAGLVERTTGRLLLDLSASDIGQGHLREGSVVWAPDSRRFAYFSERQIGPGQTVVVAAQGVHFQIVPLPALELPDRKEDAAAAKATLVWSHLRPLRWDGPASLILRRHDYFEGKHPDGSLDRFARLYEITWDLATGAIRARVEAP